MVPALPLSFRFLCTDLPPSTLSQMRNAPLLHCHEEMRVKGSFIFFLLKRSPSRDTQGWTPIVWEGKV